MNKAIKILFSCALGLLFLISALEIDVFDYDNTFLDIYDCYLAADSNTCKSSNQLVVKKSVDAEISLSPFTFTKTKISTDRDKDVVKHFLFHHSKFYLLFSNWQI